MTPAQELLVLLVARHTTETLLGRLKQNPPDTAPVTRALAIALTRGAGPDRILQAFRQLQTSLGRHDDEIHAATEFLRRYQEAIDQAKKTSSHELEAAAKTRLAQLDDQRKQPNAPTEAIEAEIARLHAELTPPYPAPAEPPLAKPPPSPRRKPRQQATA